MSDQLERRYGVTALPTAEEVLAGKTQGGVAAPTGFFSAADLSGSQPEVQQALSAAEAWQRVEAATKALRDAQDVWHAAMRREAGR